MNVDQAMQLARQHHLAGRLSQAEGLYRQVLQSDPNHHGALHSLGLLAYQVGRLDVAADLMRRAIALDPSDVTYHANLGEICRNLGRLDEAAAVLQRAVGLDPKSSAAHYNLGLVWQTQGRLDEAAACYQSAIAIDPRYADAYSNLGTVLQAQDKLEQAVASYRRSLACRTSDSAYNNLSAALRELGELHGAETAARDAIRINARHADAHNNLGISLVKQGRIDEAFAAWEQSLALDPQLADGHYNLALGLLLKGDYARGWAEHEWRRRSRNLASRVREFPQPLWDGSDIAGRRILLHAEQGFGDVIQFIRYAPLVAKRGAHVIVECQTELRSLLEGMDGVAELRAQGEPLPPFHVQLPLLSLPLPFRTMVDTVPAEVPYLRPQETRVAAWRQKLALQPLASSLQPLLKVGLVWTGRPKPDPARSCPLALLAPLGQVHGIAWYSLQVGEAAKQADSAPPGLTLINLSEQIKDFADTAAIIANLDLVISIDTAVAHLAGALGQRVWTLLPFSADWRWLLDRNDTPWYPTMRLFRQNRPGEWDSVIQRVADELARLADETNKSQRPAET